jgi:hypothetical protein
MGLNITTHYCSFTTMVGGAKRFPFVVIYRGVPRQTFPFISTREPSERKERLYFPKDKSRITGEHTHKRAMESAKEASFFRLEYISLLPLTARYFLNHCLIPLGGTGPRLIHFIGITLLCLSRNDTKSRCIVAARSRRKEFFLLQQGLNSNVKRKRNGANGHIVKASPLFFILQNISLLILFAPVVVEN